MPFKGFLESEDEVVRYYKQIVTTYIKGNYEI